MRFETIIGIPEEHRSAASLLYDQAFGEKLALAIPNAEERIALFEKHFNLAYAIAAVDNSALIGIAGFSTSSGSLTGSIKYSDLISALGFFRGNRAALVLSLYERQRVKGELLMDGISVNSTSRGLGVGTQLLSRLQEYASEHGYSSIRLDVIDSNPSARRLYEREGFIGTKTEEFEFLRKLLGFGAVTTMIKPLENDAQ